MKSNWITLLPFGQQIWLNIGFQCIWLNKKDMVVSSPEPTAEGWQQNGRYSFRISDQAAKDMMYEWMYNGPFVMEQNETGDLSLMRMPLEVQTEIRKAERTSTFKTMQKWRTNAA